MSPAREPEVPWARLVALSLGAAALVLLLATLLIGFLRPGAVVGLVIALGGLVGAVVALALVSRRVVAGVLAAADREDEAARTALDSGQ